MKKGNLKTTCFYQDYSVGDYQGGFVAARSELTEELKTKVHRNDEKVAVIQVSPRKEVFTAADSDRDE